LAIADFMNQQELTARTKQFTIMAASRISAQRQR
jgi:hypothetical protein